MTDTLYNPVKWTVSTDKISPNEYNIIINLKIDEGWKIASYYCVDHRFFPFRFNIENERIEVLKVTEYPPLKNSYKDVYDMQTSFPYYTNEATITLHSRVLEPQITIRGEFQYMPFSDEGFLEPTYQCFIVQLEPNIHTFSIGKKCKVFSLDNDF